jgi:hypothetical protein
MVSAALYGLAFRRVADPSRGRQTADGRSAEPQIVYVGPAADIESESIP